MGKLDGKVAFITGAGSGMGGAAASLFAREGAKVVVADIWREGGEDRVAIVRDTGGEGTYIETDVTDPPSVERSIAKTVATYGKINVLYNDAGGSTSLDGPVTECPVDEFWRAIKLDLFGTFLCCKYGIPELIKAGGGAIVNMTSVDAITGMKNRHAHTAAEGGRASMKRPIRLD